jgi:hypothetical protein
MSDLERNRAITFLSLLGVTLLALIGLQSDFVPQARPGDALQLCAVSKGALCDEAAPIEASKHALQHDAAELGHMLVTAPRTVSPSTPAVADLGTMTVTARRVLVLARDEAAPYETTI